MALTKAQHDQLEALAARILDSYTFIGPPVAVERILSKPPLGLTAVDISDLSLIFSAGEHQYEYRLALGRLLYREILRDDSVGKALPFTREAAAYFAMALLLPAAWIQDSLEAQGNTVETLSARYQVSRETMARRLKQLGAAPLPTSSQGEIDPQTQANQE